MAEGAQAPLDEIDTTIADLGDWRGDLLARVRELIIEADPHVVEGAPSTCSRATRSTNRPSRTSSGPWSR